MEADLLINSQLVIPGSELVVSTSRSSGPGGQHVNKTSSRVSLRWNIALSHVLSDAQRTLLLHRLTSHVVGEGEILLHVESERSQHKNRALARERLAKLIQHALRPEKPRVATRPTAGSKTRRIQSKIRRSVIKKLRRVIED